MRHSIVKGLLPLIDEISYIIYMVIRRKGGVVDLAEGKSTKFSYATEVVFENETKEVAGMVWSPSKKLTPGKYTVQLFTEGYLMGSSALTLR